MCSHPLCGSRAGHLDIDHAAMSIRTRDARRDSPVLYDEPSVSPRMSCLAPKRHTGSFVTGSNSTMQL